MSKYYIYGITKDNGSADDPDEAIDRYFYHKCSELGEYCGCFNAPRQYLVDRVKEGLLPTLIQTDALGRVV